MQSRSVVVAAPVRTPVGRFGGALRDVPAETLAARVVGALIERTGIDPSIVDDVILGQCYPNGEAPAIGRVAALDAGLPTTTPGTQVDRRCGSGLQAICFAGMEVATGVGDVLIAGGAESMSQVEFYATGLRWGARGGDIALKDRLARARVTAGGQLHPVPGGMLETAENVRRQYGFSRQEQDDYALLSHQRAVAAQDAGRFDDEIVPVTVPGPKGTTTVVDTDEHPRRDVSPEGLARLRAVLGKSDPESTVTAGNSSGQNDGAAVCVVTTEDRAAELGLRPAARLLSWAVAGVPPEVMGIGPVPAAERALGKAGLTLADMDLIELNEAFAVQVLAVYREWGLGRDDLDRVNVNGSGISLGHPVGATGCRMLATMLHELERRDGRYGLVTMCIGGGQGLAAVFERVAA